MAACMQHFAPCGLCEQAGSGWAVAAATNGTVNGTYRCGQVKFEFAKTAPPPFKGEVGRGMGALRRIYSPIPTPTLPLKGREYLEQVQT